MSLKEISLLEIIGSLKKRHSNIYNINMINSGLIRLDYFLLDQDTTRSLYLMRARASKSLYYQNGCSEEKWVLLKSIDELDSVFGYENNDSIFLREIEFTLIGKDKCQAR